MHLHRLDQAGLAYAEVSDEWIESKHYVNKVHMPLYHLYRTLDGENNYIRTGDLDKDDSGDSVIKKGDGRSGLTVGRTML